MACQGCRPCIHRTAIMPILLHRQQPIHPPNEQHLHPEMLVPRLRLLRPHRQCPWSLLRRPHLHLHQGQTRQN